MYFCVFVFEGRIEMGRIEIGRIKMRANCHSPLQHTHDTFAHTYIRMNIWPTHVVGANGNSPSQRTNSPSQEVIRPHKGAFRPLKGAIHLNHNNQQL